MYLIEMSISELAISKVSLNKTLINNSYSLLPVVSPGQNV